MYGVEDDKNTGDIAALERIIKAAGSTMISSDIDDEQQYIWNEEGRLIEIHWNGKGLTGALSLCELTGLTIFECNDNQITELDVSRNHNLTELHCNHNHLETLDMRDNTMLKHLGCVLNHLRILEIGNNLETLSCSGNQLQTLHISHCPKLEILSCAENCLSELDVSKNSELYMLLCDLNELTELDVICNTKLNILTCEGNPLKILKMKRRMKLEQLQYDAGVRVLKRTGIKFRLPGNIDSELIYMYNKMVKLKKI